jgi:hypothetical protein
VRYGRLGSSEGGVVRLLDPAGEIGWHERGHRASTLTQRSPQTRWAIFRSRRSAG